MLCRHFTPTENPKRKVYDFLSGRAKFETRFDRWCDTIEKLPRTGRRVLTHPVATVSGFIAAPETHIFLQPVVTPRAAREYGFELFYNSRPSWKTYAELLEFAETIGRDLADLKPRGYDGHSIVYLGAGLGRILVIINLLHLPRRSAF